MSQLLTWAEVDTAIQYEMRGSAPDEQRRLDAIMRVLYDINSEFDIEQTKRTTSISVVTDGETAYDLSSLVTDNDVKKIKMLRYSDLSDSDNAHEYRQVDHDTFVRHVADSVAVPEFTVYYEDGTQYLKVNDYNHSSTAATLTLVYYSTFVCLNGTTFTEELAAEQTYTILLPRRFKNAIVAGACEVLFPMAGGMEAVAEGSKYGSKYRGIMKNMHADMTATKTQKPVRKLKIRPY